VRRRRSWVGRGVGIRKGSSGPAHVEREGEVGGGGERPPRRRDVGGEAHGGRAVEEGRAVELAARQPALAAMPAASVENHSVLQAEVAAQSQQRCEDGASHA
jgi:hypothetical protein